MDRRIAFFIFLLLYLTMPVLMAYIVVKLFVKGETTILTILFFSLIALELLAAINKVIKYKKDKE